MLVIIVEEKGVRALLEQAPADGEAPMGARRQLVWEEFDWGAEGGWGDLDPGELERCLQAALEAVETFAGDGINGGVLGVVWSLNAPVTIPANFSTVDGSTLDSSVRPPTPSDDTYAYIALRTWLQDALTKHVDGIWAGRSSVPDDPDPGARKTSARVVHPVIPLALYRVLRQYCHSSLAPPRDQICTLYTTTALDTLVVPLDTLPPRLPRGVELFIHAGSLWAICEDHTGAAMRAAGRDKMARSKWKQFDQLVGVIPPGGSLGIDDKAFIVAADPSNHSRSPWAEDGLVRFEGGAPVMAFRDPRTNIRCLMESQAYRWKELLSELGHGGQDMQIVTDYMGIHSARTLSQILHTAIDVDVPAPLHLDRPSRTPTPPSTPIHPSYKSDQDPLATCDRDVTPTQADFSISCFPTPPDSSFGSRPASIAHMHVLDESLNGAHDDLPTPVSSPRDQSVSGDTDLDGHSDPRPSSGAGSEPSLESGSGSASGDSYVTAVSGSDETASTRDASRGESLDESEVKDADSILWTGRMDERGSWEASLYPALAKEHARLRGLVENGLLIPSPPPPAGQQAVSPAPKPRALQRVRNDVWQSASTRGLAQAGV